LDPDGSKDIELKIKDLPDIIVGDYHRQDIDLNQQEEAEEALATIEAKVASEEANEVAYH
jgi:hypothetical protein